MKSRYIVFAIQLVPVFVCKDSLLAKNGKPNIILIVADDLGYGDLSSYGATCIQTPHIDEIVNGGVRFTDAHSTSATSTPSRYAMLTGMYPWKNANASILSGDAPLIIDTSRITLPKVFRQVGYKTAVIGKWHLGLGDGNIDWNKKISPGPLEVGFDYSCIYPATNDRVPTVYIENGYVLGLKESDSLFVSYTKNFEGEPTALSNPELLKMNWSHGHNCSVINGIPRIGYVKGGKSAYWRDEEMADYLLDKVKEFIDSQKDTPFFLYYALHQPHVPRVPNNRFANKSILGPRGDAIIEADWCVGELLAYLEKKQLIDNTIIIFTSDNGPVLDDGYEDGAVSMLGSHKPSGILRGGKGSLFEAGTRIPFAFYWKGHVFPDTSDALVSQMDLLSSFADMLNVKIDENIDSECYMNTFMGKSQRGRKLYVMEAQRRLAFRFGDFVLIPPYKGKKYNSANVEYANFDKPVLYNLSEDISQIKDISDLYSNKIKKIKRKIVPIVEEYYYNPLF